MTGEPSKAVLVGFKDLLDAFEFVSMTTDYESRAYVCASSGKIYTLSDLEDWESDAPDDIETSDDYIPLPDKRDFDLGRNLVFAFVDQEMPDAEDTVAAIFRRKGAYGRFKYLLSDRGMLDKWYAFEASATEKALRDWCAENGIRLRDEVS